MQASYAKTGAVCHVDFIKDMWWSMTDTKCVNVISFSLEKKKKYSRCHSENLRLKLSGAAVNVEAWDCPPVADREEIFELDDNYLHVMYQSEAARQGRIHFRQPELRKGTV